MIVGTDLGNVHRQRQGTGLATTLAPGNETQYAYLLNDEYKKRKDAAVAAKKSALDKLSVPNEYWYRHQSELSSKVSEIRDTGTKLIAGGMSDLFTSTDPRAMDFRRKYDEAMQLANASNQLKAAYTAFKGDIDKAGPDDYDDETIISIDNFYSTPLTEIVKKNLVPPHLLKKRPYMETFDFMGKNMAEWSKAWAGNIPDDTKVLDFTTALVQDPANKERVVRSYGSKLAQMPDEDKQDIIRRANKLSIEPHILMAFDDAKRWQKQQEPFDPLSILAKAANTVEGGLDYKASANPNSRSLTFSKEDLNRSLNTVVNAVFNERPEWFEYYSDKVERLESENDGEYAARVKKAMREDIRPLVGTKSEYALTDRGKDESELKARKNDWIKDLRSGDPVKTQSAAQWAINGKMFGNLNIEDAQIRAKDNGEYVMNLTMKTPLALQTVQDEMSAAGFGSVTKDIDFIDKQGQRIYQVPLGRQEIANQMLGSIYDNTFKAKGANYDPSISERQPEKLEDFGKRIVPLVPQKRGTAASMFK